MPVVVAIWASGNRHRSLYRRRSAEAFDITGTIVSLCRESSEGAERVESERIRLANEGQPLRVRPVGVTHSANMADPRNG